MAVTVLIGGRPRVVAHLQFPSPPGSYPSPAVDLPSARVTAHRASLHIRGFSDMAATPDRPLRGAVFFYHLNRDANRPSPRKEAILTFATSDLAGLLGLSEAAIRQWLCRAPAFNIGAVRGHARTYNIVEALCIAIAAELFRHRLGRPHEVLPIARQIAASGVDAIWVHRPAGGPITTSTDQPIGTAVRLPLAELRCLLVKH